MKILFYPRSLDIFWLYEELYELPVGFEVVQLGEIADIIPGLQLNNVKESENSLKELDSQSMEFFSINASNFNADGSINLSSLSLRSIAQEEYSSRGKRHTVYPNDILISRVGDSGKRVRVGYAPTKLEHTIVASHSLWIIRITDSNVDPQNVFDFFRSDKGQLTIRRLTSMMPSRFSITSLMMAQLPIFLPKSKKPNVKLTLSLNLASYAINEISEKVLPLLNELDSESKKNGKEPNFEVVASRISNLITILVPKTLSQKVLSDYPMPIALAYRMFEDARFNTYEQILRLRDLFEAASYFLYNVVLADAIHYLDSIKYFVTDKGERTAYKEDSMHKRMSFVATIRNISRRNGNSDLFLQELTESKAPDIALELQSDFRNRLSHTRTAPESQQLKVLDKFKPLAERMLIELEFLTSYQLVRIPFFRYEKGKIMRRMEIYRGTSPFRDEAPVDKSDEVIQADCNHLVLINKDEQVLDLHPMYQLLACEQSNYETHICFLKRRKQNQLLGESIQGAYEVEIDGFEEFENLTKSLLDKLPSNKGLK